MARRDRAGSDTMLAGRLTDRLARHSAELLVAAATAGLLAFYYLVRADTIGVSSPARGWFPMTLPPLPVAGHFVGAALLLGVLPVVLARGVTGMSLRQLGLGLGDFRRGMGLLAVGLPLAVVAGAIGSASPAVSAVYPLFPAAAREQFVAYSLVQFLYFASWEVLFRGVLLFGLRASVGNGAANVVQTALSVTAHFGRAINETFAAFPAGLLFGWISLRLGSIWYIAIIHWVVGISLDWFIVH